MADRNRIEATIEPNISWQLSIHIACVLYDLRKRHAVDKLRGDESKAIGLPARVDARDAFVIEAACKSCLAAESLLLEAGKSRDDLECARSLTNEVGSGIDVAHCAAADELMKSEVAEAGRRSRPAWTRGKCPNVGAQTHDR